jgi:hypothetical protein
MLRAPGDSVTTELGKKVRVVQDEDGRLLFESSLELSASEKSKSVRKLQMPPGDHIN